MLEHLKNMQVVFGSGEEKVVCVFIIMHECHGINVCLSSQMGRLSFNHCSRETERVDITKVDCLGAHPKPV